LDQLTSEFHAAVIQLSDVHISVLAHCLAGRCRRHSNGTSGQSILQQHSAQHQQQYDVVVTVMAQVDKASVAAAFSSTSW